MLFHRETIGSIANYQLFYQASKTKADLRMIKKNQLFSFNFVFVYITRMSTMQ